MTKDQSAIEIHREWLAGKMKRKMVQLIKVMSISSTTANKMLREDIELQKEYKKKKG